MFFLRVPYCNFAIKEPQTPFQLLRPLHKGSEFRVWKLLELRCCFVFSPFVGKGEACGVVVKVLKLF